MKRSLPIVMLLTLIFAFTNCEKKKSDIIYKKTHLEEIKKVRKEIVYFLSRNAIPGATFAVAKNGQIIYSEGMGLASKDFGVPVTRESKFRIGALSELFTSFIYLRMVEEGTILPDSSVQAYLPDFPKKEYQINMFHLVNQISGLSEVSDNNNNNTWQQLNVSLQKGINTFKDDPLISPPGVYQTENLLHYNLLGAAMEKASGKKFNKLLKEYVTDTLNLTNTFMDNPFTTIEGRTDFFDHNIISQVVHATSRDLRQSGPSRGILSNAEDLVKFGNAILYSDLLSEETKNKMFKPIPLYEGIPSEFKNGWMLMKTIRGEDFYGKNGTVTGGTAAMILYPEQGLVIACTTNLSTSISDTPVFSIAEIFYDAQEEEAQN